LQISANGKKSLQFEQRAEILGAVFLTRTIEAWDTILTTLKSDPTLAKAVLLEMSYRHQFDSERAVSRLSESNLVDLYRILAASYPIEEDSPFEAGIQEPITRRGVAEFREDIPRALAARDSLAGCDALALLASEFEQSREQTRW
jgi:hypothetical protein